MKYGVFLPQHPLSDISEVRDLAQTFEAAGFDYLCTGGHILSSREGRYPDLPNWVYGTPMIDPFVLLAYIAGVTSRIRMITSIAILPALSTAVVAKQALELAFASNDRFELGVGLSWQEAEYRALGHNFRERGRRMSEQLEVIRRLWTEPYLTYKGEFHDFNDLGFGRLPNKPIPLWVGTSTSEKALQRAANFADGWMCTSDIAEQLPQFRDYLVAAGRDPASINIMFRIVPKQTDGPDEWVAEARRLQKLGVSHINIWPNAEIEAPEGESVQHVLNILSVLKREVG